MPHAGEHHFQAEDLRAAYAVLSSSRVDYNVRKWDAVRTGSVVALGIFAATAGLLSRSSAPKAAYVAAAVTLPISALLLWWWTHQNIKTEARNQYSDEFSMYQIEKLLGLHEEIPPANRWLPQHAGVFSAKNTDIRYGIRSVVQIPTDELDLTRWLDEKTRSHVFTFRIDVLFGIFLIGAVGFSTALLSIAFS